MKQLSVSFRVLLTIIFFGVGAAKLADFDLMAQVCEQMRWGERFCTTSAVVEMAGAAMLWIKGKQFFAAILLLTISTVYLSLLHYILIGPYTIVITALTVSLVYIHRDQV